MTDDAMVKIVTVVCAAVPAILTGVGLLLRPIRSNTEVLVQKVDEVHTLVNSEHTRLTAELAEAKARIEELQRSAHIEPPKQT